MPPGKGEARIADILSDFDRNAERPFFASLEPHLQTFDGRGALSGSVYDNPYKFDTPEAAFEEAVAAFRKIAACPEASE